jgi:hypothetical protein
MGFLLWFWEPRDILWKPPQICKVLDFFQHRQKWDRKVGLSRVGPRCWASCGSKLSLCM